MSSESITGTTNKGSSLTCPGCGAAAGSDDAECRYCNRVLSSVACDHCFARLFRGMRYCPQCGSASAFSDGRIEGDALACPGCGDRHCTSLLQSRKVGEHLLHECVACHGIWLTSQTVDAITSDANARALFAPDGLSGVKHTLASKSISEFRYRRCPHCATFMTRVNVAKISGVIVDRCADHGTFFDLDELHALVRFLESGGLDRARAREREDLAMERRRLQMLMDLDHRRRVMDYSQTDGVPAPSVTGLLTALLRRAAE